MRSMTAFATKEIQGDWGVVTWELKSVNHRFLELSFRLPEALRGLENELRGNVRQNMHRGKLDCTLRYQGGTDKADALILNKSLALSLVSVASEFSELTQQAVQPELSQLLNWPGVVKVAKPQLDVLKPPIMAAFAAAFEALIENRRREGVALKPFLQSRLQAIRKEKSLIEQRLPETLQLQRERLLERFKQAELELDANRLEQEMVLFAQKIDVSEELDRLTTHLEEVEQVITQGGVMGRRLDFLMQELNREANTLNAKSTHMVVIAACVQIKVLIEQLREQIQNIE